MRRPNPSHNKAAIPAVIRTVDL